MTQFINTMIFILGASIGSFLNVLIDRLPKNQKITGRSHCDYCRKQIKWYDLIPVVSFFILKGKSRCCHRRLSYQYPLIELLTGLVFVFVYNFNNWNLFWISDFGFMISLFGIASCFIVILVTDMKYHLVSDYLLTAFFIFSLLFHLINHLTIQQFSHYFFSGLIVGLPLFLIYYFSREKAMGLGDVYIASIIGFFLGYPKGLLAVYIAFVLGAIVGVILLIYHKKKIKSKIAFGPFLIIGTVIMFIWGEKIIKVVRGMYGV